MKKAIETPRMKHEKKSLKIPKG